jgi:hypothetical protein
LQTKVGIKMGTLPGVVCPTDLVEIIKCPDWRYLTWPDYKYVTSF